MPWKLVLPAVVIAAALGCSPSGAEDIGWDDSDADPSSDTDATPSDDDTGLDSGAPPFVPSYWGVSGAWVIAGGQVDPVASSTTLSGSGDDADCAVSAAIVAVTALELPAEPAFLLSWWRVDLAPEVRRGCGWGGPTTVELGLGQPDVAVQPAADRAGLAVASSYGLYARDAQGRVVVVGVAGTEDQLAGVVTDPPEPADTADTADTTDRVDTAAVDGPARRSVPDGVYRLVTLYSLPLEP